MAISLSSLVFSLFYYSVLVTIWVYFFIYSHRHKVDYPWGFSILIIGILVTGFWYSFDDSHVVVLSISFSFLVSLFGVLCNVNNIRELVRIKGIGWFLRLTLPALIWGILFGFLLMTAIGTNPIQADPRYSSMAFIAAIIQTCLTEELLFRGYFLSYLFKYGSNQSFAIVFQSLMFTILHIDRYSGNWRALFIVFLVGIVTGYLTWEKNSLIPAFVLHISANLILLGRI